MYKIIVGISAMTLLFLAFVSCGKKDSQGKITATGTLEAVEVTVSAKESGELKKLLVDEGSRVKAGDTLAIIDHNLLDIQLRQAQAGVDLAQAQLQLLRQGARDEDKKQAEEALKQAEANFNLADTDAKRMRELFTAGSVPQKQKDDAETRQTIAQSALTAAQEAVKKIQHLARTEEIKAAQARVAQAQTAVDFLAERIRDCTFTSPAQGMVTHRLVEKGELIGPGSPVMVISEQDTVEIMIYLTEVELGKVKLGDRADISIDVDPKKVFSGTVVYISPQAEFTPKNVQTKEDRVKLMFGVKVRVPNPEGTLKAGMPADAVIKIKEGTEAPRH